MGAGRLGASWVQRKQAARQLEPCRRRTLLSYRRALPGRRRDAVGGGHAVVAEPGGDRYVARRACAPPNFFNF